MVAPKPWLKDWSILDGHYEELLFGVGTAHNQGSRLGAQSGPFRHAREWQHMGLFALLRDDLKRPSGAVFRTGIKDIHGTSTSYLVSLAWFVPRPTLFVCPTSSQQAKEQPVGLDLLNCSSNRVRDLDHNHKYMQVARPCFWLILYAECGTANALLSP